LITIKKIIIDLQMSRPLILTIRVTIWDVF